MSVFSHSDALRPKKSLFKGLSHSHQFTCDMGQLYPVLYLECYPGDVFKIGSEVVVRMFPMVAPIMHQVNVICNYFFVPYRLLSDDNFDWETFITGGKDGDGKLNGVEQVLPRWDPTNYAVGSLWDAFCFPLVKPETTCLPYDFPRRAYNRVYNEYFRDENLIDEVAATNENILYRCWKKDYFTSALLNQQRGTAPALPGEIMYLDTNGNYQRAYMQTIYNDMSQSAGNMAAFGEIFQSGSSQYPPAAVHPETPTGHVFQQIGSGVFGTTNDAGGVADEFKPKDDYTPLVYAGPDVSDLRLSFQIQKWMERNNRGGYRYTEVLRSHFGYSPADERVQRSEYIGGCTSPIIVSEVLQTGSTDSTSPQGNMAGHGISADSQYIGKYRVKEHGCILGICCIMPSPSYCSQGVDREFLRRTRFDFYWPELANLSEQAIENVEICATGASRDYGIFGYQGRYNELRWKGNKVSGLMRKSATNGGFAFWHLARMFDTGNPPNLNASFVRADNIRKDYLAVPSQPACVVTYGNVIRAVRPLPKMSIPGLVDHH